MAQAAKQEVMVAEPVKPQAALTPMEMLDRAIASGSGTEVIERLMTLQERWEANQARKAFNAAIAAAKAEIPAIVRNRQGHNQKRYADFAKIAEVVEPILSRHNLGFRFRSEQGDRINVTCILFHKDGHSEETTLSGPPDKTGNKNDVQAIGSTLTYLQRYSLVQALGLAATDDDDAKAAGAEPIAQEQAEMLTAIADEVGADKAKFCEFMGVESIAEIPARDYQRAVQALEAKRKKGARKGEAKKEESPL